MSIELVTGRVWSRLNGARRKARKRAWVAVAYFGKGAAKLLSPAMKVVFEKLANDTEKQMTTVLNAL